MRAGWVRFGAVAAVCVAIHGCGGQDDGKGADASSGASSTSTSTSAASGGARGGAGGSTTAASSVGAGGEGGSGGSSSAMGSGGASGSGGSSGGIGGDGAGGGGGSGGDITNDGGRGSDGGVAVCWPDSMVIHICHQLENACENCPPGGPGTALAKACFALVEKAYAGMADDAACAKFAVDNKCTVDSGGNVCGSLDCSVPGCTDKTKCEDRKGWGDTTQCKAFLATCSCR